MARDWTDQETNYLKRYAAKKSLDDLAQRFDTESDEVATRLAELGLVAKDQSGPSSRLGNEPLLEVYEQGLQALHANDLDRAEELFGRVAEECDQPELAERARQLGTVCRERRGGVAEAAASEDPFLAAVYEKNRGNFDQALELAEASGRHEKDERFAYLAASIHAVAGRPDQAVTILQKAIGMNEKNRIYAFHDPDFAPLRESDDHRQIFRLS